MSNHKHDKIRIHTVYDGDGNAIGGYQYYEGCGCIVPGSGWGTKSGIA